MQSSPPPSSSPTASGRGSRGRSVSFILGLTIFNFSGPEQRRGELEGARGRGEALRAGPVPPPPRPGPGAGGPAGRAGPRQPGSWVYQRHVELGAGRPRQPCCQPRPLKPARVQARESYPQVPEAGGVPQSSPVPRAATCQAGTALSVTPCCLQLPPFWHGQGSPPRPSGS